jgi:hypothetical protein
MVFDIIGAMNAAYPTLRTSRSADFDGNGKISKNEMINHGEERSPDNVYVEDYYALLAENANNIPISIYNNAIMSQLFILRTGDTASREEAVEALGIMRATTAVPNLIAALNDPEESVRIKAAESLGKIKDPSAINALATL